MSSTIPPKGLALALTLPATAGPSGALASITAINSAVTASQLATFSTLKTSIEQDYTATFATATQKIQANLAQIESQLTAYALLDVSRAEEVATLVEAEATAQAQILQLQDDASKAALEKAENEAGQLFDALLTGSSKKISAEFEKVFEQIATAPVKKLFEVSMAAMLKPLDDSLTNAVKPYVTSISNWIASEQLTIRITGLAEYPRSRNSLSGGKPPSSFNTKIQPRPQCGPTFENISCPRSGHCSCGTSAPRQPSSSLPISPRR